METSFVFDKTAKKEREQLLVVFGLGKIFSESL